MELHIRMQLEGEGHQVGGDRPRLGKIALNLGEYVEIEAQERLVERRREMQRGIGVAAMWVVMRRLRADRKVEIAAAFRRLRIGCADCESDRCSRSDP